MKNIGLTIQFGYTICFRITPLFWAFSWKHYEQIPDQNNDSFSYPRYSFLMFHLYLFS